MDDETVSKRLRSRQGDQSARRTLSNELFGELVVDVLVDEDAVGADARLAREPELGRDEAVDSLGDVGVGKDGKDGVAAELKRALLERRRGLLHQEGADGRRAGERHLADVRVGRHLVADVDRVLVGRQDVDDTLGKAGLLNERREGEGRERRLRRRLDDGGAAGSERGGELARLYSVDNKVSILAGE